MSTNKTEIERRRLPMKKFLFHTAKKSMQHSLYAVKVNKILFHTHKVIILLMCYNGTRGREN